MDERPMTLDEWVKELPICHPIHTELLELKRAADWGPKAASYSRWGLALLLLGNILWWVGHHFNL